MTRQRPELLDVGPRADQVRAVGVPERVQAGRAPRAAEPGRLERLIHLMARLVLTTIGYDLLPPDPPAQPDGGRG